MRSRRRASAVAAAERRRRNAAAAFRRTAHVRFIAAPRFEAPPARRPPQAGPRRFAAAKRAMPNRPGRRRAAPRPPRVSRTPRLSPGGGERRRAPTARAAPSAASAAGPLCRRTRAGPTAPPARPSPPSPTPCAATWCAARWRRAGRRGRRRPLSPRPRGGGPSRSRPGGPAAPALVDERTLKIACSQNQLQVFNCLSCPHLFMVPRVDERTPLTTQNRSLRVARVPACYPARTQ